jgi:hypothetical protein
MDPHLPVSRALTGAALALLVALSVVACGDDGETAVGPTGSTTAPTTTATPSTTTALPTTTTAPSTTTTPPSTTPPTTTQPTTTTTAPACPDAAAVPPQADNTSLAEGDLDGDGALDTIRSYTIGDPMLTGAWWLQVSFGGGGTTALQVTDDTTPISGVRPFDGADLNGNGDDEFFAKVGSGASVEILGLFDVIDCELRRVTVQGEPTRIPVGGSVQHGNGIECQDEDLNGANDWLILYTADRLDDTSEFAITLVQYALADGELQLILADDYQADENDPGFAVTYYGADCPGLESFAIDS